MHLPDFLHHYDGTESPLKRIWRNINLMVGNSQRFNCKRKGYRMKMTLSVMTVYILMFTLGLFAGDLAVTKVIHLEKMFGLISTAAVYSMGFSVIYDCFTRKCGQLAGLVSALTIATQTAFVFNLFPIAYTNMLYYVGSMATMVFIWSYTHKDRLANSPKTPSKESGFIKFRS